MRTIEFSMVFGVADRNPQVLHNEDGWTHKGKLFRTEEYRAVPDADDVVRQDDGTWVHVNVTRWRWARSGPILNADGNPRKDNARAMVWVKPSEVPGYAQRALLKEIERRAKWAQDEIALWVQAAKDQVTDTEVGVMTELS
jgi:hypothetical protein